MTISKPSVSITILPANQSISTAAHRVLIVGQMKTTGTASQNALTENIDNSGGEDALFGADSMVAAMVRAFRRRNKVTPLDVIAFTDASGTNASGTVAFSGTATESGTLYVTVGSYKNHRYAVPVTAADTATTVGAALVALIAADTKAPFTSVNTTGSVAITYDHDGLEGNYTGLRVEGTVAGITTTVTAFASGATQPAAMTASMWDLIGDKRYHTIVWPTSYTRSLVHDDLLEDRWNVNNTVLDGLAVQCQIASKADIVTAADALNVKSGFGVALKLINDTYFKGNMAQEFGYVVAAQVAALRALRLTEGANLSGYVNANVGPNDIYGGPALASLPYFNTPLYDLPVIPTGKGFTISEIEDLRDAGISTLGNNPANNTVILGECLTYYKTDTAGNVDPTFSFVNAVDTSSQVREYFVNNLRAQFSQCRLTEGDLIPNRSIANQKSIEAFMDKLFLELGSENYVLVQSGEAARKFFKANRSVSLNLATGTVTINMQVPIVTQLREIVATMQIAFSVNG